MVFIEKIKLQSTGKEPTYINIKDEVADIISKSGVKNGICAVMSPHTTCSVFFEEYSHDTDQNGVEFLQLDLNNALEKIIPRHKDAESYIYPGEEHYKAVESWPNASDYLPNGDRSTLWNGDAHLKSTLLGASEVFLVEEGKLAMGTTGYIYFVDFDVTRPRTRTCNIVVIGD